MSLFFSLTSLGVFLTWNSKVYRNLAFFFLYQSVLMLLNFLEETQITGMFYLITPVLTLLVGPLLYFFVRSIVQEKGLSVGEESLHLAPMFVALPFTNYTQTVIAFGSVSQILYLALAFRLMSRYHKVSIGSSESR